MKFCEKCGAQVEDNNAFCLACGAPMETAAPAAAADGDKKQQYIKYGAIGVVAIVVIALILSLFGGGAKSAAKKYAKVAYKGKTSVKSLVPKDVWDYYDDEYGVDIDDVKDAVEDRHDDMMEYLEKEYGKKAKISYQIKGTQKLDNRDVKKIGKALDSKYDIDKDDVKAAKKVEIYSKVKGDGKYDADTDFVTVVKIKGKWYPIEYNEESESAYFLLDSYASSAANED